MFVLQEIARQIRPNTIRAIYGKTKVENAVHVTDLPEDAPLEVNIEVYCIDIHYISLNNRLCFLVSLPIFYPLYQCSSHPTYILTSFPTYPAYILMNMSTAHYDQCL